MSRTKGWKLVWAVALAVALWQFALLGLGPSHAGTADGWSSYVLPWLSRLLISAPVIALGIVVGCLTRPHRPERRAAAIAALAALAIVLPLVLPAETFRHLLVVLLGRGSWEQHQAQYGDILSVRWLAEATCRMLLASMAFVAGAAVSGWVGANYWRRGSWTEFWRGPGGAILKGGVVAGMASVALGVARWSGPVGEALRSEALASGATLPPQLIPLLRIVVVHLSSISGAAVITALLVSWRPTMLIGAFAGSGISLGLFGASMAYNAWQRGAGAHGVPGFVSLSVLSLLFSGAVTGAIAGSFAGRWRDGLTE